MPLERHEQFGYDFIKAVLLWLDSGVGAVLREFTHDPDNPNMSYRKRRPVSLDADIDAVDLELIPYLHRLASENAVDNLDDESSQDYIFRTEVDAVNSLARAMRIPFADLAGHSAERDSSGKALAQDREMAIKFWAYRVCRAVLKNAAIDVTYSLVDTAFGEFMGASYSEEQETTGESSTRTAIAENEEDEAGSDEEDGEEDDEGHIGSDEDTREAEEDSDSSDDEEEEATFFFGGPRTSRSKMTAGKNVPCITHTNRYRGHCNVETTKDVNFFGLQDEYVISGSDCGNFFIWDKKTTKLLNILEGDNEVVNVVQGHPYEPMIAVSGIDSTVKIFGIDARARKDAAMGRGIEEVDRSRFSSIGLRGRRERQRRQWERLADEEIQREHEIPDSAFALPAEETPSAAVTSEPAVPCSLEDDDADPPWYESESLISGKGGLKSKKRMQDKDQIVSKNDMDRRTGARQGGFITRGMLAMLAQHMTAQAGAADGDGDEDAEADPEGCILM
jgi:nuclear receptor interaction protein